jgi:large subunit ribosomal protein L28
MANICQVCDKRPRSTYKVSHAHNRTKRWVYPNVHTIRYRMKGQASIKRGAICTKCVKAGKVEKVISAPKVVAALSVA